MQQHLKLKALLFPLIPHIHCRLQPIPAEGDAILQSKVIRPGLAYLGSERRRVKAEIKLDAVMTVGIPISAGAAAAGTSTLLK